MPHHHPHHEPHRRKHPRARHHHAHMPDLNSLFVEALAELSELENVEGLISTYAPHLAQVWAGIKAENLEPDTAFALLQIAEAQHILQRRADLIRACALGHTVVVLPLPPHVTDILIPVVSDAFVLTAEHRLPPHLAYVGATPISTVLPNDIEATFNNVTCVVFEGLWDGGELLTRRSVVGFLQTLARVRPQLNLYVHLLPHHPHDADLVRVGGGQNTNFI